MLDVASTIFEHDEVEVVVQLCHWYVKVIGVVPLQVPSVQLYVVTPAFPVVGVTDGAIEFEGGVVGAT